MSGTLILVGMINEMGGLTTKNFSIGHFEVARKISGEYITDLISSRLNAETSHQCMKGCIISCSSPPGWR